VEDLRSSLKAGDVLVVLPEGHQWSDTEKTSYLLIKMKLTEEEAQKLMQAETKEVKSSVGEDKKAELSDRQSSALEKRLETVRERAYRLKIETLGFDVQKFWENNQQPFQDKVYDWKLAEKK
jgi:ketol-acid reductoisomerase